MGIYTPIKMFKKINTNKTNTDMLRNCSYIITLIFYCELYKINVISSRYSSITVFFALG